MTRTGSCPDVDKTNSLISTAPPFHAFFWCSFHGTCLIFIEFKRLLPSFQPNQNFNHRNLQPNTIQSYPLHLAQDVSTVDIPLPSFTFPLCLAFYGLTSLWLLCASPASPPLSFQWDIALQLVRPFSSHLIPPYLRIVLLVNCPSPRPGDLVSSWYVGQTNRLDTSLISSYYPT